MDSQLLWWQPYHGHDAARLEQLQVVIEGVLCRNGGQDDIEFAAVVGKEVLVLTGGQNVLRTKLVGLLLLAQGAGNHGHFCSLGRRDLDTHVAQSA